MIDFAKLPPLSTVRSAIWRERNKVVSNDQALKIACKKRGWNINAIRQYLNDSAARKPGSIPTRKSLMRCVLTMRKEKLTEAAIIRQLARRYGLPEKAIAARLASKPEPDGRWRKKDTELGVCECGKMAALKKRYGKTLCRECLADNSRDVRWSPTPEDIAAGCAEILAKNPRNPQGYSYHPAEVAIVEQLGVLNGRAGSWSAYE